MIAQPSTQPAGKILIRLLAGLLLVVLLGVFAVVVVTSYLWRDAPAVADGGAAMVIIKRGSGLREVARQLEQAQVISDAKGFELLARRRGVAGKIQAGEYAVSYGRPMREVLEQLVQGRRVMRAFLVVPGTTAAEVAADLAATGLDPNGLAAKLIRDPQFCASLDVPAPSLEGFLYPETYSYERGDDAKTMLQRMVRQFFLVWNERFAEPAKKSQLSPLQIVTLASIIEKETAYAPERPQIARVFFNRLNKKMRLQADPTVIYALGEKYTGNLTAGHLRTDHPYNTYVYTGLPPGPICNPQSSALAAVLSPAQGDWLYFVADGAGAHVFSATLAEHNRAVRQYRRKVRNP